MILSIEQAYLAIFYFLDRCWEEIKTDDLGCLLGAINPYLFKDCKTADSAYWEDWLAAVIKVTTSKNLSSDEAFEAMIFFLEGQMGQFDFDLKPVIDLVQSNTFDNEFIWKSSIRKSITN